MNKLIILLLLCCSSVFAQKKPVKPAAPVNIPQTPTISFGKSNIVYANIDNPMTVSIEGVPNTEIQVACEDANLTITSLDEAGKFVVRPFQPGDYTIVITSRVDWRSTNYVLTAKAVPPPAAMLMLNALGLRKGGEIPANTFKASTAMLAQIENFDFEAKCVITGFTLTHIPKKGEPINVDNTGPMFGASTVAEIKKCLPGDLYIFSNVKAKLSGEADAKPISTTIAYYIK